MARLSVDVHRALRQRKEHGATGGAASRIIAQGDGWTVADVVCTSGPGDRAFEERHSRYSIAVVLAGSFQYRSRLGYGLMTPGSVMLGNQEETYECGHEHAAGDRCVAFQYAADYFERVAADAGAAAFAVPRLPPLRELAPLVARSGAGLVHPADAPWEEIAVRLAADAVRLAAGLPAAGMRGVTDAERRVSRVVRLIDHHADAPLTLGTMARHAGLSPYHFLRTFERVTGVTPHQYVLRSRLREAAVRLSGERGRVVDVALDCGFGDVSNFNRAFRGEFGVSPLGYRAATRPGGAGPTPAAGRQPGTSAAPG